MEAYFTKLDEAITFSMLTLLILKRQKLRIIIKVKKNQACLKKQETLGKLKEAQPLMN